MYLFKSYLLPGMCYLCLISLDTGQKRKAAKLLDLPDDAPALVDSCLCGEGASGLGHIACVRAEEVRTHTVDSSWPIPHLGHLIADSVCQPCPFSGVWLHYV